MNKLDPKSVWFFFFNIISRWFFVLLIIFLGANTIFGRFSGSLESYANFTTKTINWLWFIVPALIILAFVWAKLHYHFYRYELAEEGLKKEYGVISKKYVTIPYDRIQNVDINRNLLSRILGVSDVTIQTAGDSFSSGRNAGIFSGASEGRLPGLSKDNAEKIRDYLIKQSRQSSQRQGL